MDLGIMTMQIEQLVPAGIRPEQALQYVSSFDHAGLVRSIANQGFKLIELSADLQIFFPHTFAPPAIESLLALKAELGLRYTVHLPLWSIEPSTPAQPVRAGSLRALIGIVQATKVLEPEAYVLHATGALAAEFYRMKKIPEGPRMILLSMFQAQAAQTIKELLAQTGLPTRKLALETVEFPFHMIQQLAEQFDTSICLDVGHVLAGFSGAYDLFDVLERVLPRLGEIHLHDAPMCGQDALGYGKDHQPLGTGDLDTPRLMARLAEANWNGPIIFELTIPQALESLQHIP